ncbi:MAG TPA: MFS transporter [Steroidobacteraceae bacterium]|jgi:EmrB/QacA subfamily drug resistance transporter|nr:MFS transporter [Steroidobacteraceae bacterium]
MTASHSGAEARRAPVSVLVLLVGTFMAVLDFFIVNIAIPGMQRGLRASDAEIELVVAGYAVAYGSALIIGGRLGDLFGRKRVFLLGVGLFTASSAICGFAPNAEILIVGRLAQGLAAALLSPQVLAIFSAELDAAAKKQALVAYGFVMGIASVFAQVFGGLLIGLNPLGAGWRVCFLINVPIGLIAMALTARMTPESRAPTTSQLDVFGMLLILAALAALTLPLIEGQQHSWPEWDFILLAGSVLLFLAFSGWEMRSKRRGAVPLVDFELFHERSFTVGLLAQLVFYMSMAGFYLVLAIYLQLGRGLTPLQAGLIFIANGAGYLCTSSQVGWIAKHLDQQIIALAGLIRAIGLGVLLFTIVKIRNEGSSLWLVPGLFLNGAGTGLAVSPLASTVLSRIGGSHAGAASGVLTTGLQVGNAIGVALIGVIFYATLRQAPSNYAHAFGSALIYLVALSVGLMGLVQLLPSRGSEQPPRSPA